jgi:hypothetical protein
MSTKFEQLLDLLVNEEMDKANELFHEIVVEQSRSIYENLIAEEADEEEMDEASEEDDESMDEASEEDDESVEENMDLEDSYSMEADDEETMGGDPTDDLGGDVGMGDMGDDEEGHEASEDSAIMDIKNAIEELEAAFAELQQAQGDEHTDMDGMGDMGADDSMGASDEDEGMMMGMHEGRRMTREYVENVGNDWEKNSQKTDGDYAGAGTGEKQSKPVSGKSPISSGSGKPQTGAGPISSKDGSVGNNTGTSPTGKAGGFLKNAQDMKTGNGNVPGGKMGVKNLSKVGSGYPGNNKTPGPVGSGTGDKAGQTSVGQAKSPINGAPNRNA